MVVLRSIHCVTRSIDVKTIRRTSPFVPKLWAALAALPYQAVKVAELVQGDSELTLWTTRPAVV